MLKNPEKTKNEVVQWIRDYFAENGPTCSAVVGVSGGKDSSVTAALCAEALGADRVVGVLMPNGVDSRELVAAIGIPFVELNIEEAFQGMKHMLEGSGKLAEITGRTELSNDTRINLPPRLRMATLYAVGQMLPNGARVANTCNLSESPLAHLCVEEVLQIGEVLGLPEKLVKKTPSDGLSGVGDEEKLGFTYAVLDRYIRTGEIDDEETKAKIDRLHRINLHKLRLMPAFEPEEL